MLNKNLINEALNIAIDYLESERIPVCTDILEANIIDWYNHSDITDPYMLAAVAIDGSYNSDYVWNDIIYLKTFYFGTIEEDILGCCYSIEDDYQEWINLEAENFSIEEIEMAQHDMEWW